MVSRTTRVRARDKGRWKISCAAFSEGPSGPSPDQEQRGSSLGSGFVVDHNGYILTNNHVVERASRIRVKFNGDPTQYDARVIGTDKETDLAVIKIEKSNLTPAKIGNSDSIQVGDWAVAIGSPFGFQETVTAGIISAKARDIPGDSTAFQHFLQTDAAINPGNSGGPLLNINGEVIGINTQIASRSGGYQGIGFAMPINTAVNVYNQIIKSGKVTRGSIGIHFREGGQSQSLLKAFNATQGVFVEKVEPGGPAEKAGLQPEDIITSVGGQRLTKSGDLIDIVADTPVGTALKVEYIRDGKPRTTTVTVGDRMKVFASQFGNSDQQSEEGDQSEATPARFGISIQNLTDRMKENLHIKEDGVLVQGVEPGSFAEEDLGLTQGDVITAVNRKPVTNVDEFKRIQSSLKTGDAVALRVLTNTGTAQKPVWQQHLSCGNRFPLRMRNKSFWIVFAAVALCLWVVPQAQAKSHKTATRKAATKTSKSRARKTSAGRTTRASSKGKHNRRGRYSAHASAPAASWRNRQLAPTSDRYREIQQALASKGYLKSTPNGAWDGESQEALKRFQADQHLDQTGKLNSLSLIALGLGPAKTESPAGSPAISQQ